MLFSIKNKLFPTLLLFIIFAVVAFYLRHILGLSWQLNIHREFIRDLIWGLSAIFLSDVIIHCTLWLALRDRYLNCYRSLVEYFKPQSRLNIAAGGLLAGGEELVFRGVILQSLMQFVGLRAPLAISISAILFGLFHMIIDRRLLPFAIWAVWEGILLGCVYVVTGSLILCMLIHTIHDVAGFTFFAIQRRTGFLLNSKFFND